MYSSTETPTTRFAYPIGDSTHKGIPKGAIAENWKTGMLHSELNENLLWVAKTILEGILRRRSNNVALHACLIEQVLGLLFALLDQQFNFSGKDLLDLLFHFRIVSIEILTLGKQDLSHDKRPHLSEWNGSQSEVSASNVKKSYLLRGGFVS